MQKLKEDIPLKNNLASYKPKIPFGSIPQILTCPIFKFQEIRKTGI